VLSRVIDVLRQRWIARDRPVRYEQIAADPAYMRLEIFWLAEGAYAFAIKARSVCS